MNLPSVKDFDVAGKKVLLRTNYDVPLKKNQGGEWVVVDDSRINESLPTIKYLLDQKARVVIISHLGRPEGREVPKLSLGPVAKYLERLLDKKIPFSLKIELLKNLSEELVMLENLRFWSQEEENEPAFAQNLASLADFYINDAFACSHRRHASIVGVPKFLPGAFGFDFLKEVEILSKVRDNPRRPVVLILGGEKKDKIDFAKKLISWADWILVGGKLVEYDGIPNLINHQKVLGNLIREGQDITMKTAGDFGKIIAQAGTIVWSGPMGNFYDKKYALGTKEVAQAVVKSSAFKIVGGGDTEVALEQFGLVDKIDYISSGGGAMLEFLAEQTLPGLEAIKNG